MMAVAQPIFETFESFCKKSLGVLLSDYRLTANNPGALDHIDALLPDNCAPHGDNLRRIQNQLGVQRFPLGRHLMTRWFLLTDEKVDFPDCRL